MRRKKVHRVRVPQSYESLHITHMHVHAIPPRAPLSCALTPTHVKLAFSRRGQFEVRSSLSTSLLTGQPSPDPHDFGDRWHLLWLQATARGCWVAFFAMAS